MASSTTLWALERGVGYDHAERVGRVPRDDEIQDPWELTVKAAAAAAAARRDWVRLRNGA